mmetsp:Transcript_21815/g.39211  ORF Transcript_21815/g.39211 Transcript_21815/m.39211 type:complete len:100 (-) Transcript_21815:440-739(-)
MSFSCERNTVQSAICLELNQKWDRKSEPPSVCVARLCLNITVQANWFLFLDGNIPKASHEAIAYLGMYRTTPSPLACASPSPSWGAKSLLTRTMNRTVC